MAAQWPLIVARLVTLLPTLPRWAAVQVFDGAAFDIKSSTSAYATVAHATDGTTTTAGSYTWVQASDGFRYAEQGSVACQIVYDGDNSIGAVRGLIFALIDDLHAAIRADRTLGVLSAEGTAGLTVDVSSMQAIPGVSTTLAFSIDYYTVT